MVVFPLFRVFLERLLHRPTDTSSGSKSVNKRTFEQVTLAKTERMARHVVFDAHKRYTYVGVDEEGRTEQEGKI